MPKSKSFSYGDRKFSITEENHGLFRLVDPVTGKTKKCQIYAYDNEKGKSVSIFLKIEQAEPLAEKAGLKIREKVTKQKESGGKKVGKKKIRDLINLAMKNGVTQEEIEKLGFEVEAPKKAAKKTRKSKSMVEESEADASESEAPKKAPKKKTTKKSRSMVEESEADASESEAPKKAPKKTKKTTKKSRSMVEESEAEATEASEVEEKPVKPAKRQNKKKVDDEDE